jgi:hypothetical protein
MLDKRVGLVWTGFICLRIRIKGGGVGSFERDNEPSGSIKYWEILE